MRKPFAHRGNVRWVIDFAERRNGGRRRGSDRENAEPMFMQKFEVGIMFGQFGEQAIDAKIAIENVRIVKQHDPAIGQLRPPALKIVLHRFVRMQAINMQEINRAVGKTEKRVIEFAFQQF